ncbi:MAG: hypothetical protein R3C05_00960 [Pirellulaceae bacterium]
MFRILYQTTTAFCLLAVSSGICLAQQELSSGVNPDDFSNSIAAGENFYEFINEGWLKNNPLPGDQSNYGVFTKLNDQTQEAVRALILAAAASEDRPDGSDAQKVGDFFSSYSDVASRNQRGTEPIASMIEQVRDVSSKEELALLMAKLSRMGISQPLGYYVSPDARDSSQYAVYFSQHGTTLPDRDYYLEDDAMYKQVREAFPKYVAKLLDAVGYPHPTQSADAVLALETKLAEAQWTKVENRDPIKTYNKVASDALAETLQNLKFDQFASITDIDTEEDFIVRQPSFFEAVNRLFDKVSLDDWKAYMAFHIADSMAPVLSEPIERMHFDFHDTVISGVAEQKPLWKRGVEATGGTLGELVGKLYVKEYFTPEAKQRMNELVDNLKAAFALRIVQSEWMTPPTKKQALEKLSKFTTKIGYPDKWKDYDKLSIQPDDLAGNVLRSAEFEHAREVAKLAVRSTVPNGT